MLCRHDQVMVMRLLCGPDDSSTSDSSSDDDLKFLMLDLMEKSQSRVLGPRLNLDDVQYLECEQMFRSVIRISLVLYKCICSVSFNCYYWFLGFQKKIYHVLLVH